MERDPCDFFFFHITDYWPSVLSGSSLFMWSVNHVSSMPIIFVCNVSSSTEVKYLKQTKTSCATSTGPFNLNHTHSCATWRSDHVRVSAVSGTSHTNSSGLTINTSGMDICASPALRSHSESLLPHYESIEKAAQAWANPFIHPAKPVVKPGQVQHLTGPYSVLHHSGSRDKQLSTVISSKWNDDINYSTVLSCYWP